MTDSQATAFEVHSYVQAAFRGPYCGPEPSWTISFLHCYQLGSGPQMHSELFKGSVLAFQK